MRFIELTYLDDTTVFLRLDDIVYITPQPGGGIGVDCHNHSERAYFKESAEQLFAKKVYGFND